MTSGWILALAVVSQTSAWGTQTHHNANGWQANGSAATHQFQQSPVATNQLTNAPQLGATQQPASSQFAAQQSARPQVDQFGRSIQAAQSGTTQSGRVAAQHPWQTNQSQLSANTGRPNTHSGQNLASQQFDPRVGANQQNTSLSPSGVSRFGTDAQQGNTNWQLTNNAQQSPQLTAPQNGVQQNTGWPAQSQTQFDARTNQPLVTGQPNGNIGSNWLHGRQATNQSQFGGQVVQNSGQTANQFGNSLRNPQIGANVGTSGSQFGAQSNVGDNRFRVADNANHQLGQAASNFGGNQSSLMLQPPERNTLPAGSHPQVETQGSFDPRVMVQPPRLDDNSPRDKTTVDDPRWTNWNQGQNTASVASRPTTTDLQPIPANQANNARPPVVTVNTTNAGNEQPRVGNSTPNAQKPQQNNQPASRPNGLFAAATRTNNNASSVLSPNGQGGQSTNAPKYNLFAAANNARASQEEAEKKKAEAYDPSFAFGVSLVTNFLLFGGVLYLGWIAFESHFRYRRALLDGDDYDDSRRGSRDEARGRRR